MPEDEQNPNPNPPSLPTDVTIYSDDPLTTAEVTELEESGVIGSTLGGVIGQNVVNGTSDEVRRLRQLLRAILAILHLIAQ